MMKTEKKIRHFLHQHKHTLSSKRQNRVELTLSNPRNKRKPENTHKQTGTLFVTASLRVMSLFLRNNSNAKENQPRPAPLSSKTNDELK